MAASSCLGLALNKLDVGAGCVWGPWLDSMQCGRYSSKYEASKTNKYEWGRCLREGRTVISLHYIGWGWSMFSMKSSPETDHRHWLVRAFLPGCIANAFGAVLLRCSADAIHQQGAYHICGIQPWRRLDRRCVSGVMKCCPCDL
jgi:hypothetical protein